jgi:ABC-type dipeptide/oligopeptide/nickel transport system ATPase component
LTNTSAMHVQVEDLSVRYTGGATHAPLALDRVSVRVYAGESRGIAGESGSGKSTLIKSILGVLDSNAAIEQGRVEILGTSALQGRESELRKLRRREIGYVGQNPLGCLHPLRTVEQHLRRRVRDAGMAADKDVFAALLASLGIRGPKRVLDSYPHELSGGMAQRVVTAIALVVRPSIVIADEPTSGLDLTVQRQVLDEMVRGIAGTGASLLMVTHDLGVIANYCDTVTVMRNGDVVEDGAVNEVFRNPRADYTKLLLSSVPEGGSV